MITSASIILFAALSASTPVLNLPTIQQAPLIDGHLTDDAWLEPAPAKDFTTLRPVEGQPGSQTTRAWMTRDQERLYVAIEALDTQPELIRSSITRRDSMFGDDWVAVAIDTYRDFNRANLFFVNPSGIQGDVVNSNSIEGDDVTWDAEFESAATRTSTGYVVEIAIPFSSLRFPEGNDVWGVQVLRQVARTGELSLWAPTSESKGSFMSQAAELRGMANVRAPQITEVIPELTASVTNTRSAGANTLWRNSAGSGSEALADVGVSVKQTLQGKGALDIALNPDFSQIESDQAQILSNKRFALSFEEKRPFFLERREIFDTPWQAVYTRSINDPLYGARLTGKWGQTTLGLLHAMDQTPAPSVVDAQWDPAVSTDTNAYTTVVRAASEVAPETTIGILAGEKRMGTHWNRVGGLDTRVRVTDTTLVMAQALASATALAAESQDSGTAFKVRLLREGRQFDWFSWHERLDPGFRAEMGFIPRVAYYETGLQTSYRFEMGSSPLVAIRPRLTANALDSTANTDDERQAAQELRFEFPGSELGVRYNIANDRFSDERFLTQRGALFGYANQSNWVRFGGGASYGGAIYYDVAAPYAGRSINAEAELTLTPITAAALALTYEKAWFQEPTTSDIVFDDNILRARAQFYLTEALGTRLISEWNSSANLVSLQAVIQYQPRPATTLFLGYQNGVETSPIEEPVSRGLFLKMSYLWRV